MIGWRDTLAGRSAKDVLPEIVPARQPADSLDYYALPERPKVDAPPPAPPAQVVQAEYSYDDLTPMMPAMGGGPNIIWDLYRDNNPDMIRQFGGRAAMMRADAAQRGVDMPNFILPEDIAYYTAKAGFSGEDLVNMVAISLGESSGDIYALGDDSDEKLDEDDGIWGPSVGLYQVRSLSDPENPSWANHDRWRVYEDLFDPEYNAQAARKLFEYRKGKGGTGYEEWSVWNNRETNGLFYPNLPLAREAIERMMSPDYLPPEGSSTR